MKPFGTTTSLLQHQVDAVEKVKHSRVGALFMQMGTGKSRTAIELARLRSQKIDRVIWYCPVSLKETIRQEILKHTDCENKDIYVFDDKTTGEMLPAVQWYVIGIESMSSSNRVVTAANEITSEQTFVVLDESSYIKGHNSLRTQRITMISKRAKYRVILTGTPISQGIVDLFSQMRFLSPKILGYNSFYSFAANHLEYSEKFPDMVVRAHNVPYIAAKIQPYVYQVTKEECLDLPDKMYQTLYFYMTEEQKHYYEQVKEEIFWEAIEYNDNLVSIAIFRLFSILQGIVCGFWNRRDKLLQFKHKRLDMLMDAIYSIPENEKVIILCKYRYDIEHIQKIINKELGDVPALFYGDLNERKRAEQVEYFRKDARFFLATQSSGGHGLTLNEAHYVIFYNNAFKYAERLQAEDRCHRIGQENKVTYIDITCTDSIDDRIMAALYNKGDVVQAFKTEVDRVKGRKGKLKELITSL